MGLGESGLSRIASRYSAIASSSFPWSQGDAEVVVGLGVVGLEPDRRAVFGDRLVQLPLVSQGVAEVVVGLGVVGLEPDRLAEFGDRLVQLPLAAAGRCRGCCGPRRSRA